MKHLEVEVILEQLGIDPNAFLNWILKQETGDHQQAHSWKSLRMKSDMMRISKQGC